MRRFRNKNLEDYSSFTSDEKYNLAYKRFKQIKSFYIHLTVFIIVNSFIILANLSESNYNFSNFWRWETFATALFWGIGLASHGFWVFGSSLFFGKNWEERKIKEFMSKDSLNK